MKIMDKIVNYIKDSDFKIIFINNSVNIINYDNILEVSDEIVNLSKEDKIISIRGKDLKLNKLLDKEILITGIINQIEL